MKALIWGSDFMKVFINPGHAPNGVPDPGAVNPYSGLKEAVVVKCVGDLVAKYLTEAGVDATVCQDDSLATIVNTSNSMGADVFVSIHCNSAANPSAEGTETFYFYSSEHGKKLANCIQSQLIDAMDTVDRGIKGARPGTNGLYVLTNTDAVAVLVELAFISNQDDSVLLTENQDDFARAIARGVTDYQLIM
jgi:N-acetylmuramoyl-L-alanine amidase